MFHLETLPPRRSEWRSSLQRLNHSLRTRQTAHMLQASFCKDFYYYSKRPKIILLKIVSNTYILLSMLPGLLNLNVVQYTSRETASVQWTSWHNDVRMKLPLYSQLLNNNNCHLQKCHNIFHQYMTDATRYVIQNTPQLKLQIYSVVADLRQNSNQSLPTFKCSQK